jgi:hypothetical protein
MRLASAVRLGLAKIPLYEANMDSKILPVNSTERR